MKLMTFEFTGTTVPNGSIFYVVDELELIATLETGRTVTFSPGQIQFNLPSKNDKGQDNLSIVASNTDQRLVDAIEAMKRADTPQDIIAVVREYDIDDLSKPCAKPIRLTTTDSQISIMTISAKASWRDLTNRRFATRIIDPSTHPGTALMG